MLRQIIILLTLILTGSHLFSAQHVIRIAYDKQENPPYNLGDHKGKKPGLSFELLNMVGKKLDIKVTYQKYPWKRCLSHLKTDISDAAMDASFKEVRREFGVYPMLDQKADPSRANNVQSYFFYARSGSDLKWDGKTLTNFEGKTIAVTRGYSIISQVEEITGGKINIHQTDGTKKSLELLSKKRIDAIADLNVNIEIELLHQGEKPMDIIKLTPPLRTGSFYLLLSKHFVERNPQLAKQIWQTVKEIRSSAKFKELEREYHLPKTPDLSSKQ